MGPDNTGTDYVYQVEHIILSDNADKVTLTKDSLKAKFPDGLTIDGGGQPSGSGDKLDLSTYVSPKHVALTQQNGDSYTFGGALLNGNTLSGTGITFKNFEILYAPGSKGGTGVSAGDVITGASDFKNIYLGNGDNLVDNVSGGVLPGTSPTDPEAHWQIIHLGSGTSTVEGSVAAGSKVYLDPGHQNDQIEISPDVEFFGANSTDRFDYHGFELSGGTRNENSDSAFYYDHLGFFRYAVTDDGSLVVEADDPILSSFITKHGGTVVQPLTFIDNFQNTSFDGNQVSDLGTGGITLATIAARAGLLLDPELQKWMTQNKASIDGGFYALTGAISKAWTGQTWAGVDPLVLDLGGSGVALSTLVAGASERFDVNGDGFANPSAWGSSSEGLLVKLSPDGTVTSGSQFVGSTLVDGFADLSAYDVNGDGKVDDTDLADPRNAGRPQLRVWVDANYDHVAQASELLTLDQAGIASISLTNQKQPSGTLLDGSQVLSNGTITMADGSTHAASDVLLKTDNSNSTFLGDKTVTAEAASLPDLAGHGTLPDLAVALSLDEKARIADGSLSAGQPSALERAIATATADLSTTPDIAAWRTAALPILTAWTAAFADPKDGNTPRWYDALLTPNGQGTPASPNEYSYDVVTTNADGSTSTTDRLERQADGSWAFASGQPVLDSLGQAITGATLEQALDTPLTSGESWAFRLAQYEIVSTDATGAPTTDHLSFHYATVAKSILDTQGQTKTVNVMSGFWSFDSGRAVTDANGNVISNPTLDQALGTPLASGEVWKSLDTRPDFYTITMTDFDGTTETVDALEYIAGTNGQQAIGYWAFASGRAVTDLAGTVITHPTLDQALASPLATNEAWSSLSATELNFAERYEGDLLPFGQAVSNSAEVLGNLTALLGNLNSTLDLIALRLAVQGPLKSSIFAGIS